MHSFSDFVTVIEQLITFSEELTAIESKKLEAATKNRISFVEDCMKDEQAATLRLRGLDRKRETIQTDLGWEGWTFKQILSQTEDEKRAVLEPLFIQLNDRMVILKNTCDSASQIIQVNLHKINNAIQEQQHAKSGGYTPDGVPKSPERHLTNKKI